MQDKSNRKVMKDQTREKLLEYIHSLPYTPIGDGLYDVSGLDLAQLQALIQEQEQEIPEADWGKEFDKLWMKIEVDLGQHYYGAEDDIKQFIAKQIAQARKEERKRFEKAMAILYSYDRKRVEKRLEDKL